MCSTGALVGFQVAQGVTNYGAARSNAKVQEIQQAAATESLIQSTLQQEAAIQVQTQQAQEEIAREMLDADREARRVRASNIVRMSEAGQAGASAQRVIDDIAVQADRKQVRLDAKSESVNQAELAQLKGLNAQHYNQLNQINQPINKPSALGAAIGIGANVAQTIMTTKAIQSSISGPKLTVGQSATAASQANAAASQAAGAASTSAGGFGFTPIFPS
ncbi:hypothetical protein CMI37_19780 [Candidatus Pacearchaeota archaeon]|nr:hypothetical protein [Candidatus Pacearchaeota archaeon]|tara:strand:- start:1766 stop:2422 length:657 start_codon:yes stop_codon:yes gene_type:complete